MGSTVEQARPHLTEQAGYAGERGRPTDKTRATSSSGQVGRNDGSTVTHAQCTAQAHVSHESLHHVQLFLKTSGSRCLDYVAWSPSATSWILRGWRRCLTSSRSPKLEPARSSSPSSFWSPLSDPHSVYVAVPDVSAVSCLVVGTLRRHLEADVYFLPKQLDEKVRNCTFLCLVDARFHVRC